jgi:phosphomevalonate kinase
MANTTVISSPGKVLAAGGYLVLDPAYSGVVISTSSRFYSVVRDLDANGIQVRSPQFIDAVWNYSVELTDKGIKVEQIPGA